MSNDKLTEAQRTAKECPDCGEAPPGEPDMHWPSCRRVAKGAELQCGPPWNAWPTAEED